MDDIISSIHYVLNSLQDKRSKALFQSVANLSFDAAIGGAVFYSGLSLSQLIQKSLKISSSVFLAPSVFGGVTVICSSVLAVGLAPLPRRIFETSELQSHPHVSPIQFVSISLCGIGLYRLLGGRFFAIAPSDYRNLGSFHLPKASLPATTAYADTSQRAVISSFGKLFGCHTCGSKSGSFHADHMPPVNFVKAANSNILRRMLGLGLTQRFYPQCKSCSNQQGMLVQKNVLKLKSHFFSFRPYHGTGGWLVLLCTSGLLADNIHAKESSPNVAEKITDKAVDVLNVSYLELLRAREKALKHAKEHAVDRETIAGINAELKDIKQKKLKAKQETRKKN